MKRLIVNADDFGFTHDVNSGIVEAHRTGILTAATLMANGAAFDDAVRLSRANPGLDVGCHLVLIGGLSLADEGRALPSGIGAMLSAVARGRLQPYRELHAQVVKILNAGLRPTHLDTHKHTHLFPPVLDAVARIAREFDIRWVRRPFDLPVTPAGTPLATRLVSRGLKVVRRRFHRVLDENGCRTTDHFAGFQMTGRVAPSAMVSLLRSLPDGLTEFMTHPGHHTAELESAQTRLKASRALELAALTSLEVRRAIGEGGIELTRYSEC